LTIAPVIQPHRLARLKLAILLLHSAVTIVWAEPVAASANWATNLIPEPLLYDLTLPLDTPGGQVEVNSIFRVPAGTGKVISVPEIEGTVADGLGFELEIEFDGSEQNGWSAASQ